MQLDKRTASQGIGHTRAVATDTYDRRNTSTIATGSVTKRGELGYDRRDLCAALPRHADDTNRRPLPANAGALQEQCV